jgi:zinc transporter ZupT
MEARYMYGFMLASFAGACTLIGAAAVYLPINPSQLRLASCFCLACAAGVMTYVSLVEVFGESRTNFGESFHAECSDNQVCIRSLKF